MRAFFGAGGLTLYGLILFHELERRPAAQGLVRLVQLVANGHITPRIEVEASWTEIGAVAQRLINREFAGKAVLHVR